MGRKILGGLFLALALLAATQAAAAPLRVPAQFCRGYYFVPMSTAGSDPLWFLFDTGAPASYIDPDSLARVGGQRNDRRVRLDMSAGPVRFDRLDLRTHEFDDLAVAAGHPIDGLLGFPAFRDYLLTLDYAAQEMRIDTGILPEPDNQLVFTARGPDVRPWIEVRVGQVSHRMLIDSGSGVSFRFERFARLPMLAPARTVGNTMHFNGPRPDLGARYAGDIFIGGYRFTEPTMLSIAGPELMGTDVLRHFVLTFDQRNRRVRLVRNGDSPIRLGPITRPGVLMVAEGQSLRVTAIVPDTPASNADIRAGDTITHINGAPVANRPCTPDSALARSMTRTRDGQSSEVTLATTPLVP